jgi:glucose-6-phosphate 1-dehydrogenase
VSESPAEARATLERHGRPADRCAMVIFGASGDLTKRKLIPSLYHLARQRLLPNEFALVGCAIENISEEDYRKQVRADLAEFGDAPADCKTCDWMLERTYYFSGDFNDAATYEHLKQTLETIDSKHTTGGSYLYYLATAPVLFGEVVKHLGVAGLAEQSGGHWRRVVIEKPFGHDLDSARTLNREIGQVLSENQIYRIDHYLGKETVQNILVFRF